MDDIHGETCPKCGSKETTYDSGSCDYHCGECGVWFDAVGVYDD